MFLYEIVCDIVSELYGLHLFLGLLRYRSSRFALQAQLNRNEQCMLGDRTSESVTPTDLLKRLRELKVITVFCVLKLAIWYCYAFSNDNYFQIKNLFCLCLSLCGMRQSLCGRSMKCCVCNVFSTTNELLSRTAWSSLSGGESRGLSYRAGMTMSDMTLLWLSEQ